MAERRKIYVDEKEKEAVLLPKLLRVLHRWPTAVRLLAASIAVRPCVSNGI